MKWIRWTTFVIASASAWATIHWFGFVALIPLLTFWASTAIGAETQRLTR